MDAEAPSIDEERMAALAERDPRQDRPDDELVMDLERDQLVAETSLPVAPAVLSAHARAGLWALRVFVLLVSAMVIYTFFYELH